jgi:hypothetical protein
MLISIDRLSCIEQISTYHKHILSIDNKQQEQR